MAPLSVVLVVHREQGFVRACLRSLRGPAGSDVRVLVVDDRARDHSAEIAAEESGTWPAITIHALPERVGPGGALAAALPLVETEYVWFVEPLDLLADGGLAAVEAALEQSEPDLLLVPRVVRDVFGGEKPGPALSTDSPTPVLWDKVARTSLLRSVADELQTGPGWQARTVARLREHARSVEVLDTTAYVRRALPAPVRARSGLDDGPTAQTARPAPSLRRTARRLLSDLRHPGRLRTSPRRAWYALQRRLPLDPHLAVFGAYWFSAYSCNPRAIYEKACELRPELRGVWVVEADAAGRVPAGVPYVVAGSRAYDRVMARATYFVNNVNFPNDWVKRPGQVFLQTHHGTPLKVMGMDLATSVFQGRKMNYPKLLKRVATWDYSISQNAFTSEQWERVYPSGTYESLETGYPRNDVLATATEADVAAARAELGIEPGTTTVLYLPTHREYHPGYVPQLDAEKLAAALGPDHLVLLRAHYFYRSAGSPSSPTGRVRDLADHPRIETLYLAADVLVTDYSSAMFDYAVLDRPVVIYAPDWDEYRRLRGTTFDLMAEPPGPVARTEEELTDVLASGRAWDDDSAARRAGFRARFCSLEDGRASERVVEIVWPATSEGRA